MSDLSPEMPVEQQLEMAMRQAVELISWVSNNYPGMMTLMPPLITNVKREKAKGPNKRPASIEIQVPEALARQIKSEDEDVGVLYLVHIRPEVLDRASSKIVLPGER